MHLGSGKQNACGETMNIYEYMNNKKIYEMYEYVNGNPCSPNTIHTSYYSMLHILEYLRKETHAISCYIIRQGLHCMHIN